MSIKSIHLRKLLQLIYSEPRKRTSLLRADIRSEVAKEASLDDGGGDFFIPFWADAKDHVSGLLDLREQSKVRIEKNKGRARLYPLLTEGFLNVWTEKARWRNERFEFVLENVSSVLTIDELGCAVKVANVVAVKIWDGAHRVVYPYFSEVPSLPLEGAQLGFWVLGQALSQFSPSEFRIVDILRSAYFRPEECALRGNEREILVRGYRSILLEWDRLRKEYE
jgi:hypothetical protein